jgi:hypothetical protein
MTAAPWRISVALLLPLVAVAGLVVWPALLLPATRAAVGTCPLGPLATVAQVDRALTQDPAGCRGRSVVVRGRAVRSLTWQAPDSLVLQSALVDGAHPEGLLSLSVSWGRPDPLLAALRRVPLLGRWVPPPQRLHLGMPAFYRVQLCAPAGAAPGCAGAVLLDADPNVP